MSEHKTTIATAATETAIITFFLCSFSSLVSCVSILPEEVNVEFANTL